MDRDHIVVNTPSFSEDRGVSTYVYTRFWCRTAACINRERERGVRTGDPSFEAEQLGRDDAAWKRPLVRGCFVHRQDAEEK